MTKPKQSRYELLVAKLIQPHRDNIVAEYERFKKGADGIVHPHYSPDELDRHFKHSIAGLEEVVLGDDAAAVCNALAFGFSWGVTLMGDDYWASVHNVYESQRIKESKAAMKEAKRKANEAHAEGQRIAKETDMDPAKAGPANEE